MDNDLLTMTNEEAIVILRKLKRRLKKTNTQEEIIKALDMGINALLSLEIYKILNDT